MERKEGVACGRKQEGEKKEGEGDGVREKVERRAERGTSEGGIFEIARVRAISPR